MNDPDQKPHDEDQKNPFLLYNRKGDPLAVGDSLCLMYDGLPKSYTYGEYDQPLHILSSWRSPAEKVRSSRLGLMIDPNEIVSVLVNSILAGLYEDGWVPDLERINNEDKTAYILSTPSGLKQNHDHHTRVEAQLERVYTAIFSYHEMIGFFTFLRSV